jgi:hypothetical protein
MKEPRELSAAAAIGWSADAEDKHNQGYDHENQLYMLAIDFMGRKCERGECIFHEMLLFLFEII